MQAASPSEILVPAHQSTRRRNPEDWIHHQCRCDNLKARTEYTPTRHQGSTSFPKSRRHLKIQASEE
jgi:hypothetical protein